MQDEPLLSQLSAVLVRWLARRIAPFLPPRRPRPPGASLVREESGMLVYKLTLPPPGAPDVTRRVLTVIINEDEPTSADVKGEEEYSFEQGDQVVMTLVDIDDAGNASVPSSPYSFEATDTLAPPQPGQLGLTLDREE